MVEDSEWRKLLAAIVRFWPQYSREGARFTRGPRVDALWKVVSGLQPLLGWAGLPEEDVKAALPESSLRALFSRHPEKFSDVLALSSEGVD
jgi:hypothetical protein